MRFRLYPTAEQATVMVEHCAQARFVWNLALEQSNCWRSGRASSPGYAEQSRQLTEARACNEWLRAGSQTVQQQALRDFDQAKTNWWGGTHRRPTWRSKGVHEGFRQVAVQPGHVRRLNRRRAEVLVPKLGWVRFRWTRPVPKEVKSYRVTLDRAGRWHIAFAVVPEPIEGPGDGSVVGIDRGVVNSAALPSGERTSCAQSDRAKRARLQRRLARTKKGSNGRTRAKVKVARLTAHEADARKDWAEKLSTDLARHFDLIRFEKLPVKAMTRSAKGTVEWPGKRVRQKAGLNRGILANAWGLLLQRTQDKARGRVELVPAPYTSQRCSTCGEVDANSRESQAKFVCTTCGFVDNADVNAAKNIAAGPAVTARGGLGVVDLPVKREPQLLLLR